MDYSEFVIQFRKASAKRMEEFQQAVEKAQDEAAQAKSSIKEQAVPPQKGARPAHRKPRGQGPVQSILRKA